MKMRTLLFSAGIAMALSAVAAPLTPQEALMRARQNGQNAPSRVAAKLPANVEPCYLAKAENGTPMAYIFNNTDEGYLIVSADDVAYPVLGYSDSGKIDPNNMSPEMKWWLSEMSNRIQWAVENGASTAKVQREASERAAIEPLMKTTWDQGSPYNDQCPTPRGSSTKCYSGCVATSMAQVMNYHKYPEAGEGKVSYYCSSIDRNLTMNFSQGSFDWDNMLNSYTYGNYNEAQGNAVAYLMKACGYSVNMGYGTTASGASGIAISNALRTYFKYDSNLRGLYRVIYSSSEWENMIYENLKNVGPVIVNGHSTFDGGHSFVCDGYDGNGYYHFNWGWSGLSDGYYSLDALNPDAQGIGGYVGGFNFSQTAIFGIQPPTGNPKETSSLRLIQYGNSKAVLNGRNVTVYAADYSPCGWGSVIDVPVDVYIGALIEPINGTAGEKLGVNGKYANMEHIKLENSGSYYSGDRNQLQFTLPELADGTYKVYSANKDYNGDLTEWTPMSTPWGHYNYFILKVENGAYTIENMTVDKLDIVETEVLSPLYSGKKVYFKSKITNNTDKELTRGVEPRLCSANGEPVFYGGSILFSLASGETVEQEWISAFYKSDGSAASVSSAKEYTLRLYDPMTCTYYNIGDVKVTLEPKPATTKIKINNLSIDCENKEVLDFDGQTYGRIAILPDYSAIPFELAFSVTKGYFDGNVTISIVKPSEENPRQYVVVREILSKTYFVGTDGSVSIPLTIDFSEGDPSQLYLISCKYTLDGRQTSLGQCGFISNYTGIEDVAIDESPSEYYNLQGVRINNPEKGQLVIVRQNGKTYKTIIK